MSNLSSESKPDDMQKQYGSQTNLKLSNTIVTQWLLNNYESAEGSSLPRRVVYAHYVNFCKTSNLEQQNPASFGKLIRGIFPNLKTRRLGTRGNSKYHYYGVRIKATSDLRIPTYDIDNPILSHPKDIKFEGNNNNIKFASKSNPNDYLQHTFYPPNDLPEITLQITDFTITTSGLAAHMRDAITSFTEVYHAFSVQFIHAVYSNSISEIEKIVRFYYLMFSSQHKEALQYSEVTSFMLSKDQIIYQSIYHLLFASILKSVSTPNIYFITHFVKNYIIWIEATMSGWPSELVQQKLAMAREFSINLQKMGNINHFSHLLKGVFNTPMLIGQMYDDLEKIDLKFILRQIPFIEPSTESLFLRLFDEFKETLNDKSSIENIATKLCDQFDQYISSISQSHSESSNSKSSNKSVNGNGSHSSTNGGGTDAGEISGEQLKAIYSEMVSKFSYYSNSIITDLTTKNAGSFSSFHIFRIFLEEFLSYYILKKSTNPKIKLSSIINNDLPSSVTVIQSNVHSSSSSSLSLTSMSSSSMANFESGLTASKEKQLLHDEYRWSLSTPTLLDSSSNLIGSDSSSTLYHPPLSSSMDISMEKSGNLNTSNQSSFISSSSTRLYHQPLNSVTQTPNGMISQNSISNSGNSENISGGRRMAIVGMSDTPYNTPQHTLPFLPRSESSFSPSNPSGNSLLNIMNNNNLTYNTSMEMRDKIALNAVNSNSISSRNPPSKLNYLTVGTSFTSDNANDSNLDDQSKGFQPPAWKSPFNWQMPSEYSDRASTAFLDLDDRLPSAKKKKLD